MIHKHSDDTEILTCASWWNGDGCWHFEVISDSDVSDAKNRMVDHLHGLHGGVRRDLNQATKLAQQSGIVKYEKWRKMLDEVRVL